MVSPTWYLEGMETTTCSHKHCGQTILPGYAKWKWSPEHGANMPFHTQCSYADPNYDVSKGCGSPFTSFR